MKKVIDSIVSSLSKHPGNTGLVVGVIRSGQHSVFGYGRAADTKVEPPAGDSLFEIGSITKVFTASLLAILLNDGLLNLDDPVRKHLPSLSNLPEEITILRLATHTAGLPKMPSNLIKSMLKDRHNPYAAYTITDLLQTLSRYKRKQHGDAYPQIHYSNLGFALLGHILAQSTDLPYEGAIVSRIFSKLGMHDTCIKLTTEQQARLSPPHSANGRPVQNWDMPAFAGAGALRSTAEDMLKFLTANLGGQESPLMDALYLSHEIRSEAFPPEDPIQRIIKWLSRSEQNASNYRQGIALGWFVGQLQTGEERVYWHHGATGGYRAFTGFVKTTQTGVVVLANRGPGRIDLISSMTCADEIGFRVLEYLSSKAQ